VILINISDFAAHHDPTSNSPSVCIYVCVSLLAHLCTGYTPILFPRDFGLNFASTTN